MQMQSVGAVLGMVIVVHIFLEGAYLWRQITDARLKSELRFELLRQQIGAAKIQRLQCEQTRLCWNGYRKFVVDRKLQETENICSLYLAPHDRKPLPLFKAGQFLTFRLNVPGREQPIVRCYTISSVPNETYYRVTIKRVPNGAASGCFHDRINEGDILDVQAPRGNFCVEPASQEPLVLIAGGVGVTPFLSMAGAIAESGSGREVLLFYTVRNGREQVAKEELRSLASTHENIQIFVNHSSPTEQDQPGRDFDFKGRISIETLKRVLPANNYDFYLCGPPSMMESLVGDLQEWGVPSKSILTEAFGSCSVHAVKRRKAARANGSNGKQTKKTAVAAAPMRVTFSKSCRSEIWDSSYDDLLSFADETGIQIESGCAAGSCGTCQTAIRSGCVKYSEVPDFLCEERTCLPCVAVPDGDLVLDV
jgi:hypothetical protein